MAFDKTQPYATVNTNAGNIYYMQNGVLYNAFDLSMAESQSTPVSDSRSGVLPPLVNGAVPMYMTTMMYGEDKASNSVRVTKAASTLLIITPLVDTLGPKPNVDVTLGTIGQAGDIIDSLVINVLDNTACAVFLRDGDVPDLVTGTTGTGPSAGTTLVLTSTASSSATANQYFGRVLSITYTPTSGTSTKMKRRIVAHAAPSGTAWSSITVDEAVPAGATITQWAIEHQSSVQLCGAALPDSRPVVIPCGRSQNGRYRLTVDKGAQVTVLGSFT
jgi:hypothetical protein